MLAIMAKNADTTLITSAPKPHSLDLEERNRRYIITMGIRTACFFAFLIVPGWWKIVTLAGAALLPAFAVLLANSADRRPLASPVEPDTVSIRSVTQGNIVSGSVEDVP